MVTIFYSVGLNDKYIVENIKFKDGGVSTYYGLRCS